MLIPINQFPKLIPFLFLVITFCISPITYLVSAITFKLSVITEMILGITFWLSAIADFIFPITFLISAIAEIVLVKAEKAKWDGLIDRVGSLFCQ